MAATGPRQWRLWPLALAQAVGLWTGVAAVSIYDRFQKVRACRGPLSPGIRAALTNGAAPCASGLPLPVQEWYWDEHPGEIPPVNRPPFYLGKFKVSPADWAGPRESPPSQPPMAAAARPANA